ncbi:hypothetical protein [Kribbella alba]
MPAPIADPTTGRALARIAGSLFRVHTGPQSPEVPQTHARLTHLARNLDTWWRLSHRAAQLALA